MDGGAIGVLIALIIMIILSGVFSGSEMAYSTCQRARLQTMADDGNKGAAKVLKLLDKYDKILSAILIGNNIVNITGATLGTILFAVFIPQAELANTISTIVVTVVVLIFGEITPKIFAKEKPEMFAIRFYYFTVFCIYLFYPLNMIFSGWRWLICKIFKIKKEASITEEELINIVETAENEGEIEAHESELIRSAIEFEDREVIDVMVPRVNVIAVSIEDSAEEIYNKYIESGYSRLPVYKDTIDNIVGILHEKDFYKQIHDHSGEIKDIIQTTLCVPSSMKISSALHEIQRNKVHMAIVVDEFGGTMGVVTLEDILEELVGEIYDEHDDVEELFRSVGDDTYIVNGEENLEEMFEKLGVTLNEDDEEEQIDATSAGGFVTEIMGKIPTEGEKCTFKNLEIEILKATATKVVEIKIKVLPQEEE